MIKRFLFLAIFWCLNMSMLVAQQNLNIKGKVIDSLSGKGIPNVTITLKPLEKKTSSDLNGEFSFKNLSVTNYNLVLSSIGYNTKILSIEQGLDKSNEVIIPPVQLSLSVSNLKEVMIQAGIVSQTLDRIIYNIQADPRSKSFNMFDMVTRVPLLSINSGDEILLNGQKNYIVFIDGKPSTMLSANLSEYLKNLKAANVASIQIITTIPARYQDQGLSGIIDIKMYKPPVSSYNGSLSTRFLTPGTKSLNSLLVTKSKKFGASVALNPSWQNSPVTYVNNERNTFSDNSTLLQQGSNRFTTNAVRGVYEMTYDLTPLDFINASVVFNRNDREFNNYQLSSRFDSSKNLDQSYDFTNVKDQIRTAFEANINYQKSYNKIPEKLLTASFRYSSISSTENTQNDVNNLFNYLPSKTRQDNQTGNKEFTLQLDYVHPVKKVTIESGIKEIFRNNFSETDFTSISNPALNQTDYLRHRQNVLGIYSSYFLKLNTWGFRAGGRLEITNGYADFISNGTNVNEKATFLLPNVLVQKLINKQISLNLNYTQRAERPGIWLLNPFIDRSNPQYISSGNPSLQSVRFHTFNLRLSIIKKWYLYFENRYVVANNTIESVSTLNPGDVVYTSNYNIGYSRNFKSTITFSYPLHKKLDWSLYTWLDRIQNRAYINNQFLDRTGVTFGTNINATYTVNNNLRLSLYGIVSSPLISYQQKSNFFYDSSIGITKYFANRKYTLSVTVLNPLTQRRTVQSTISANDFTQVNSSRVLYRQFNFSFSYRFGKVNNTVKKNSRVIENTDVKTGEGSF